MRALWALFALAAVFSGSAPASAEEACIKYHKCVPLDSFKCDDITRSSFIYRFCYNEPKRYAIVWLGKNKTPYHYCNLGPETAEAFKAAESMGRYYNANIRSTNKQHGPFDCRDHPIPEI